MKKDYLERRVSTIAVSLSTREAAALSWLKWRGFGEGVSASRRVGQAILDSALLEQTRTREELAEFRVRAGAVDYTDARFQAGADTGSSGQAMLAIARIIQAMTDDERAEFLAKVEQESLGRKVNLLTGAGLKRLS